MGVVWACPSMHLGERQRMNDVYVLTITRCEHSWHTGPAVCVFIVQNSLQCNTVFMPNYAYEFEANCYIAEMTLKIAQAPVNMHA